MGNEALHSMLADHGAGIVPPHLSLKSSFYGSDNVSCGISTGHPILQIVVHLVPVSLIFVFSLPQKFTCACVGSDIHLCAHVGRVLFIGVSDSARNTSH